MGDGAMPGDLTRLLMEIRTPGAGDPQLQDRLYTAVYGELRALARVLMARERPDHTLRPTALVNEAYLRLIRTPDVAWEDRAHFFGIASRAMREILVEHARARAAEKRGGDRARVTLDEGLAVAAGPDLDVIALHEALDGLAGVDQRAARVAELRAFGGLTAVEAAHLLGISKRTADADWNFARLWLRRRLGGGP